MGSSITRAVSCWAHATELEKQFAAKVLNKEILEEIDLIEDIESEVGKFELERLTQRLKLLNQSDDSEN